MINMTTKLENNLEFIYNLVSNLVLYVLCLIKKKIYEPHLNLFHGGKIRQSGTVRMHYFYKLFQKE